MIQSKKGTEFEMRVARLLSSSSGYKDIRLQRHILGKNVDIIFRKQWSPRKYRTIAVECKEWSSGVDREAIKSVYYDYMPLLDKREIDELWIVTPNPVGATAREHTISLDGVELVHFNELEQDVIDFSIYAENLVREFHRESFSKYYIPSRIEGADVQLHSVIPECGSRFLMLKRSP